MASSDAAALVQVSAAPEPVMRVRAAEPLALLQAAYHLGNRHVAMELRADQLLLLQDSVEAIVVNHSLAHQELILAKQIALHVASDPSLLLLVPSTQAGC